MSTYIALQKEYVFITYLVLINIYHWGGKKNLLIEGHYRLIKVSLADLHSGISCNEDHDKVCVPKHFMSF